MWGNEKLVTCRRLRIWEGVCLCLNPCLLYLSHLVAFKFGLFYRHVFQQLGHFIYSFELDNKLCVRSAFLILNTFTLNCFMVQVVLSLFLREASEAQGFKYNNLPQVATACGVWG